MKNKGFIVISLIVVIVLFASIILYLLFLEKSSVSSDTSFDSGNESSDDISPNDETIVSNYVLVDTGQDLCTNDGTTIECPPASSDYYGQDAQYDGESFSYTDNGDGTITDNVTGLMWQKDSGSKVSYTEAIAGADDFELAGYTDWRVPTIKELYSLMNFMGIDPNVEKTDTSNLIPFIDDSTFVFRYGNPDDGDRIIDSQWVTSNIYESTVFTGQQCFFGVNFADGRIKCYPTGGDTLGTDKLYYVIYVRGDMYGVNDFIDNGDETITDNATGLMWQQFDSAKGLDWQKSLKYCEDLNLADYSDWRLPNAKELQSIVDYSRSPDTTDSAAINEMLIATPITNEEGITDYAYYWTSTTHISETNKFKRAVYISFGRALGYMNGQYMDVHGAGAQRSDPKSGNPETLPLGLGPQGDVQRIENYARCVRTIN